MTRYPEPEKRYVYWCSECGAQIPTYQGVYWFTRERQRRDATVEVPYCPECKAESIRSARD